MNSLIWKSRIDNFSFGHFLPRFIITKDASDYHFKLIAILSRKFQTKFGNVDLSESEGTSVEKRIYYKKLINLQTIRSVNTMH